MNVIEKHIHEHFARLAANAASEEPLPAHAMEVDIVLPSRPPPQVLTPPFAKVNSVVEGSPAETAGLKAGDQIRNFGYVNNTNHDGLKKVGECVQGNEGVCISTQNMMPYANTLQRDVLVKVLRTTAGTGQRHELNLTLKPRRDWGGRGLLGCHILPI